LHYAWLSFQDIKPRSTIPYLLIAQVVCYWRQFRFLDGASMASFRGKRDIDRDQLDLMAVLNYIIV
jgi:hypothetical protein